MSVLAKGRNFFILGIINNREYVNFNSEEDIDHRSCRWDWQAHSPAFLANGWFVVGTDIDCDALGEFHKHDNFMSVKIDIRNDHSIASGVTRVAEEISGLNGLVNNAGIFDHFPLVETHPGQIEQILSVNVLGAARMCRAFFPLLHKQKGRIINIRSETAMVSLPGDDYPSSEASI